MTKKKTKVPATKVKEPKIINFTKTQKALYQDHVKDIQEKAQVSANNVLEIGNRLLTRDVEDFKEELGIAHDGFEYNVDGNNFRFIRREK